MPVQRKSTNISRKPLPSISTTIPEPSCAPAPLFSPNPAAKSIETRMAIAYAQARMIERLRDLPRSMSYALVALEKADYMSQHPDIDERQDLINWDTWVKIAEKEVSGYIQDLARYFNVVRREGMRLGMGGEIRAAK